MKSKIILTTAIALISTVLFAQTPKAYITNYGSDFISVIDIQKNQKFSEVITGSKPHGVAVSPDGSWIAVSNEGDNTVSIISAADNKVKQTISVGKTPHQLSFSIDGKYVLTAINGEHKVDVISTADWKLVNSIPVGKNPHIVLPMPDGKNVWVTSEGDNKIVNPFRQYEGCSRNSHFRFSKSNDSNTRRQIYLPNHSLVSRIGKD